MRDRDGFGIVEGARDAVRVFVVLAAIGTVAMLAELGAGCGGADGAARDLALDTIHTAADALVVIDTATETAMLATAARDLAEATSREDAVRRRAPYWRVVEAIKGTRALLETTAKLVEAVGAEGLLEQAGCVVAALGRLREAVTALAEAAGHRIEIPAPIDSVLRMLAPYGATCTADADPPAEGGA